MTSSAPLIRRILLEWFTADQRPLPWRQGDQPYRPYHVWIAEIMGQQTRMERVVPYFTTWIACFPDIPALAAASEQEMVKAWEGLGYYSRVRNIRRTAAILVREHQAALPADETALLALPGIGPYTAAAILSIAFNLPVPLLDANVERLLSRLEDIDRPVKLSATRKRLLRYCAELLPPDRARDFNQALMEFGALVCTPKNPACASCPLRSCCRAFARDIVDLRPVPGRKQSITDIVMACGLIEDQGRIYIQQRLADDVWGGLWEFPGGRLKAGESADRAAVREILEETEWRSVELRPLATVVHYYSRYRVTLHAFRCRLAEPGRADRPVLHAASQFHWVSRAELAGFAFPAGHRQVIAKLEAAEHSG